MEYIVLAIGRARDGGLGAALRDYQTRLAVPLRLQEVLPRRGVSEGEAMLAALPDGAVAVVLDERGDDLTSRMFAARIAGWRDEGRRRLAFLIGGPDGHGEEVRRRADLLLCFGRMTWPHQLVRVMLVEQLYRASTILAGHPYHRD